MSWIIILFIVGISIFFFLRDRDKMLDEQVTNQGGMQSKYDALIKWLTQDENTRITKTTRDSVHISNLMTTTETHFIINEVFNGVEIKWIAKLGILGEHRKTWHFNSSESNKQIIDRISSDLEEYGNEIM